MSSLGVLMVVIFIGMASMNGSLAPDIETVFLMPKDEFSYLSSNMVREVAEHRGAIHHFVPEVVKDALFAKLGKG